MRKSFFLIFFLLFLGAFLSFQPARAQEETLGQILIYPQYITKDNSFGVFVRAEGLAENKNYEYGLWVYGGKPLSQIWNGEKFVSAYTYLDIPKEQIRKGVFEDWVILKITDLPSLNYNYYLRFRLREKETKTIVGEDTKYYQQDNFNILEKNFGFVCGRAFSEDGDILEGGMMAVRGENLEYFSLSPCDQEGRFSLPLPFGEDYFLQFLDNTAEPISKSILFSLEENLKDFGDIFFEDASPSLEFNSVSASEIKSTSLKLIWEKFEDLLMVEVYISGGPQEKLQFLGKTKENYFFIENLQPNTKYYFVLKVYNKDFVSSVFDLQVQTLPLNYPSGIYINELFPHPSEGLNEEFIEIYNSNNFEVDLSFWVLKDGKGATKEYVIPLGTKISPYGYLVFKREETKIVLNDDEDFIYLFSPDGTMKDKSPPYKNAPLGFSFSRFSSDWQWTEKATPLKANVLIFSSKNQTKKQHYIPFSIKEARKQKNGQLVVVEGVVTVPPKILGSQVFYIQDSSGGIQIYFSKADFPLLKRGNKVKVYGEISEANFEKRIKILQKEDIVVLGSASLPLYFPIKTGSFLKNYLGMLVKITGKVVETKGATFYVSDGTGPLKVYIKTSTKIKKPKMRKGDFVTVLGVLSRTKEGFRILPCFQDDIRAIGENQQEKGQENSSALIPEVKAASSENLENFIPFENKNKNNSFSWLEFLGWFLIFLGFFGLVFLRAKKYFQKSS